MSSFGSNSLESVYRLYGPLALRRARQIMGNEADAQEVLHDVFASLASRPQQFSGASSMMTFLYSMTTNCALGKLRQSSNRLRLVNTHLQPGEEAFGADLESAALVRELLVQLTIQQGQLCVYYFLDEMSQAEIAELMNCSRQWVGKQLHELKQTIARILDDQRARTAHGGGGS